MATRAKSPKGRSKAQSSEDLARAAIDAVNSHDTARLREIWHPEIVEEFLPVGIYRGPDEVAEYFEGLFRAAPDFRLEAVQAVGDETHCAIQWDGSGSFTGEPFMGIEATGRTVHIRGCDLMGFEDGLLRSNVVYYDGAAFARGMGMMPPRDSAAERAMKAAFNAATRAKRRMGRIPPPPNRPSGPGSAQEPETGEGKTAEEVGRSYFAAVAARDPKAMASHWAADGVDDFVPMVCMNGPGEVEAFSTELFTAVPDLEMAVEKMISSDRICAVTWRGVGHFTGGPLQGIEPNGRMIEMRGIDCLEVEDGKLVRNTAYGDSFARQIGLLPAQDSAGDRGLTAVFNAGTRLRRRLGR